MSSSVLYSERRYEGRLYLNYLNIFFDVFRIQSSSKSQQARQIRADELRSSSHLRPRPCLYTTLQRPFPPSFSPRKSSRSFSRISSCVEPSLFNQSISSPLSVVVELVKPSSLPRPPLLPLPNQLKLHEQVSVSAHASREKACLTTMTLPLTISFPSSFGFNRSSINLRFARRRQRRIERALRLPQAQRPDQQQHLFQQDRASVHRYTQRRKGEFSTWKGKDQVSSQRRGRSAGG